MARLIRRIVIIGRGGQTKLIHHRMERNLPSCGEFDRSRHSSSMIGLDFVVQLHHFCLLTGIQAVCSAEPIQFAPFFTNSMPRHFNRLFQPPCLFLRQRIGN
jgi:hypothetical protein